MDGAIDSLFVLHTKHGTIQTSAHHADPITTHKKLDEIVKPCTK